MISDARLSHLIIIAYGLNSISGMSGIGLIENAPDWVINGDERFTIQAKAEDPTSVTEGQLLEMLRTLLADRFKLKFHRQNRKMPGFALVVARSGSKLQEAKGDETSRSSASSMKPLADGPVTVNARRYSMGMLASLLSDLGPGGPVEDRTELSGVYDFKLYWNDSTGPSVFTALQEQLGLRLEPRKVAVSFFVFESAERPGEN